MSWQWVSRSRFVGRTLFKMFVAPIFPKIFLFYVQCLEWPFVDASACLGFASRIFWCPWFCTFEGIVWNVNVCCALGAHVLDFSSLVFDLRACIVVHSLFIQRDRLWRTERACRLSFFFCLCERRLRRCVLKALSNYAFCAFPRVPFLCTGNLLFWPVPGYPVALLCCLRPDAFWTGRVALTDSFRPMPFGSWL